MIIIFILPKGWVEIDLPVVPRAGDLITLRGLMYVCGPAVWTVSIAKGARCGTMIGDGPVINLKPIEVVAMQPAPDPAVEEFMHTDPGCGVLPGQMWQ